MNNGSSIFDNRIMNGLWNSDSIKINYGIMNGWIVYNNRIIERNRIIYNYGMSMYN